MTTPFFSVIICSYNRASVLSRALQSLLNQTETDWEAIIVDDGSNDDTYSVAMRFQEQNERFRYMKHPNRGVGYSRTAGIYAAFGRYCTFLDSDDEYLSEHLATRRPILAALPGVDILHGGAEIIGNPYVADRFDVSKQIHISECVMEGTMFLRREAALCLGGFGTERYGEGAALMERAQTLGLVIATTDIPTYRYDRTSPDSLCSTFTGQ
jgi:glycosyltransferase involved in cell wall biosynthesis